MNRDHQDALMDQLLREVLGGDRPRDLAERVMVHARQYDRIRRRWWIGAASGIAASLLIAVGTWALWPQAYPEPNFEEGTATINGDKLEHGSTLATDEVGTARIGIGGYVTVSMEPETALTLGGAKYAEKVILDRGGMDVAVTKKKGTFDVAIGPALVHVTGTRFHLGVQNKELSDRKVKQLVVAVKEGSVEVSGVEPTPVTLSAGTPLSERTFEISSEPKIISRPRANPLRNLFPGGTGGSISAPPAEPTTRKAEPAATPTATTRPPPPAALSRPVQVLIEPGIVPLDGRLGQTVSGAYVLETAERRILIFAQQPAKENMPKIGTYVHVVWQNGQALSVEPLATNPSNGANTATRPRDQLP